VHGIARQRRIQERTYVDVGHYAEQLSRYLAIFPRERFHIVLLDDLRHDARGIISTVFAFLGVDPTVPIDCETAHNEAHGAVPPAALRLFRLAQTLRLPRVLPHGVNDALRRAFSRGSRCPPMDDQTRERLREHYRTDLRTLERLLDRPLSDWLSPSTNPSATTGA
jgi:hypothetical protein